MSWNLMHCFACMFFLLVVSQSKADKIALVEQIPQDVTAADIAKELQVQICVAIVCEKQISIICSFILGTGC